MAGLGFLLNLSPRPSLCPLSEGPLFLPRRPQGDVAAHSSYTGAQCQPHAGANWLFSPRHIRERKQDWSGVKAKWLGARRVCG